MAKKDSDLFDRLRQVGLRKQVAKALSEIGDGAGKKAAQVARRTVDELRSIADEIERRLPGATPRTGPTRTAGAGRGGRRPIARRKRAVAPAAKAGATTPSKARAARGENKAKILGSLKSGPKTASEIARETGIGTATVGSTLSKLLIAGDVAKADRGYRLPT
jgi:predicted Rossmann fold nucleotide-binding protein DprA/Smf involved in DNA uptake